MSGKDIFNIDISMIRRKLFTQFFNIFSFSGGSQDNLNAIFYDIDGENTRVRFNAGLQHFDILFIISVCKCSEYHFTFARKIEDFFKMLINLLIINTIEIAQFSQFRL